MKITSIKDYVDEVQAEWPEYTKQQVRSILTRAWNKYVLFASYGVDVMIKDGYKGMFYTGPIYKEGKLLRDHYRFSLIKKINIREGREKVFDGYYYFASYYGKQKKDGLTCYGNVYLYRMKDLCLAYNAGKGAPIYRVPFRTNIGKKVLVVGFNSKYARKVMDAPKGSMKVLKEIAKNTNKWIKHR